ncbi:MAG: DnaJ domain-containing protein [Pseudomonadota bacterium]
MKANRTYYDILQVGNDAPLEIIAAAYRAQMLILRKHPDLGGDTNEAALINEAYEVLSDPKKRVAYDVQIAATKSSSPTAELPKEERRKFPRRTADSTVSFCINHDNHWHPARVVDYSELGMRMKTHFPITVGQNLVIMPPNLASFALHGTVRWARAFYPSVFERVYEAGIEFSDEVEDIEKRLV